jgi:cyclin G-associated kinase
VNLEVEVEPRDRPSRETPPWENTSLRGLNPKILFSSREEQQDILSKFGKAHRQNVHLQGTQFW